MLQIWARTKRHRSQSKRKARFPLMIAHLFEILRISPASARPELFGLSPE